MRQALWLAFAAFAPLAFAANCPTDQPRDGSALIQIEHTWAAALEKHDADAVGCILAQDFEDFGVNGEVHNREQALAAIGHRRPGSNRLSELTPHVAGDFGYVRGLNTIIDPDGKRVAQVRFTDIFRYRDGRWQAVAGQETLVTPEQQH